MLPRHRHPRLLVLAFALVSGAATAFAARPAELDLKRTTPVPADQPIPIADYFRPALLQDPEINATGTHVAALISSGDDKYRLLAYELASGKMEGVSGAGDQDIYSYHWLTEQRLMFAMATRKQYAVGYHAADLGRMNRPFPLLQYTGARLVGVPRAKRSHPIFWIRDIETGDDRGAVVIDSNRKNGKSVSLHGAAATWSDLVTAREENERMIVSSVNLPKGGVGVGYLADKEGELAFAYTHKDGVFTLHRRVDTGWQTCPIDLDEFEVVSTGDEPGQLVVLDKREPGKPRALRFMDAATGELGRVLLEDPQYDFNGWLYRDPATRQIVGAVYQRNGPHVVWFNETYAKLQSILNHQFPGQVARLLGSDDSGRIFLVRTSSDRQPAVYHWVNLEEKKGGLIKSSRPWIDAKRMQPMIPIRYKTRDGLSFDAYLTLPAGAAPENPPPLLVLPHGGPWVRDSWGFDAEVQFLASRGYAVLQPNYRGSTGYSWMYPEEDEWAFRKMHDDVTDCVKAVLRSGHVDRQRVAIMGGSFGGYLALSGVTLEPELYSCAITIAGVFDWSATIKNSKYSQHDDPRYARLIRKLGDPKVEAEKFAALSPIRRVDQIRVPVFVVHGRDDQVVEVSESKRLVSELERHRIPHESLFVREEGHGMGRLKNQVELYTRVDAFLAKHLQSAAASRP